MFRLILNPRCEAVFVRAHTNALGSNDFGPLFMEKSGWATAR
jgi:hypothetical protein